MSCRRLCRSGSERCATCSSGKAPASTHARNRGEPDRGLGDVPALRRRRRSNHPRRSATCSLRVRAALTDSAEAAGAAHRRARSRPQRFLASARRCDQQPSCSHRGRGHGAEPEDAACWGWQMAILGAGRQNARSGARTASGSAGSDADDLLLDPESRVRRGAEAGARSGHEHADQAEDALEAAGRAGSPASPATGLEARTQCGGRSEVCGARSSTSNERASPSKLTSQAPKLTSRQTDQQKAAESREFTAVVSLVSLGRK